MNYQRIYNEIVNRAKDRKVVGYTEKHHIIPKCMGGDDSPHNLVDLTGREHFIVHWLLHEIYPKNRGLSYAFWLMSSMTNNKQHCRYVPSSRIVEYARIHMAAANKGSGNPMYGKTHSAETRRKMSEKATGRKVSEDTKKKISKARTGSNNPFYGRRHSALTKRKISESNIGRTHVFSENHCKNLSISKRGALNPMAKKITVNNTKYGSIADACRILKISRYLLTKILEN